MADIDLLVEERRIAHAGLHALDSLAEKALAQALVVPDREGGLGELHVDLGLEDGQGQLVIRGVPGFVDATQDQVLVEIAVAEPLPAQARHIFDLRHLDEELLEELDGGLEGGVRVGSEVGLERQIETSG